MIWKRVATVGAVIAFCGCVIWLWATMTPDAGQLLRYPEPLTEILTCPDSLGHGGEPLLLVIDLAAGDPFAAYVGEILLAEGISTFHTVDLSRTCLERVRLDHYAGVITATRSHRLDLSLPSLSQYVRNGNSLLMIDPPTAFDSLLGIVDTHKKLDNGYIQFDKTSPITSGLTPFSLQIQTEGRLCSTRATSPVAFFSSDGDASPHRFPAAGVTRLGRGSIGYLLFDLGKSVVFTRQGPPNGRDQNMDADSDGVYRATDLFAHSFDPRRSSVPQADQQQRLLINMCVALVADRYVLPRLWYFPAAAPAIALVTGDTHYRSRAMINRLVAYVGSAGGKFTLFDYPASLDSVYVKELIAQGHAAGPHIFNQRPDNRFPLRTRLWIANWFSRSSFYRPRLEDLAAESRFAVRVFTERTGLAPLLSRNHYLVWWGWSETAQLLAHNGIQMDFTVTGSDPTRKFDLPNSEGLQSPSGFGYINGSGLPMRWMDRSGNLIPIYQQLTQVEDDIMNATFMTTPRNDSITVARIIDANRTMIDEGINFYHSALVWNFHPEHSVESFPAGAPVAWDWFRSTVDHLRERNVPMLAASDWLRFTKARRTVRISQNPVHNLHHQCKFAIESRESINQLAVMLPIPPSNSNRRWRATLQGEPTPLLLPVQVTSIDGIVYALVTLDLVAGQCREVLLEY